MATQAPQMTQAQIKALIKKASEQIGAALTKAAPGEEAPAEETPDTSSSAPASSPPAGDSASSSGPPASVTGDASAGGPPPASASDVAPQGDGDPAADTGDQVTPEALFGEYSQLDLEGLKMHVAAANAALAQMMGSQGDVSQGMAPDASAPPPSPGPGASPPAGPPAMKSEMSKAEKDVVFVALQKAQEDLKSRDAQIAELTDHVAKLDKGLVTVVNAVKTMKNPALRKSAAGVSDVRISGKPGTDSAAGVKPMTKSEITVKLNEFARSGKATPADKQVIAKYCVGSLPAESVQKFLNQ